MSKTRTLLFSALALLGRSLRIVFNPDFTRSLAPFARAYYNMGRVLAEVFSKMGLIEPSHPWMNGLRQVGPFTVLATACARTNWKKPFALPTVVTAAITLLVICGTLTATATATSGLLGAGHAYAGSIFTPPSPSTDLALKYMSNSFGITIPGVPASTVDGVVAGFQKMMALYSMAMLILAGFILLYILISAIAATAHEGRFGGGSFNQVWAPIRLIVAIGLLVPLPMAGGYNGYNSGQYIVMKIAEWGSGMATNLWVPFASALASRGDVIATPNVAPLAAAVYGVFQNEFCMARYNEVNNINALGEPPIATKTITKGGTTKIFYTTDSDTQNDYCGVTSYEKTVGANLMAEAISNGLEVAYNNMRGAVATLAADLNSDTYIPVTGALGGVTGAGTELATKTYFTQRFISIVNQYQTDVADAINNTVGTQAQAAANAMTTAIQEQGWAGAAVWFNTIARLNAEVMTAARGIPASQKPTMGNAATTTETVSNVAAQIMAGQRLIDSYVSNLQSSYGISGITDQNYGANQVGNVYTPAVATGLDNSNSIGGIVSGGVGAILQGLLSTFVGGPFGTIGTGAESNLSQINPLAQLAAIGDWIITASLMSLATATGGALMPLVPVGITIIAFGLATAGLSAGILLFYVTPLMPFIRFLFAIAGWLLNVLEAIIAIPLVAVSHLTAKGEGISGDLARTAYFLILSIFLRPALLIVGMICSLMMFSVAIGILNDLYKSAVVGFMGTAVGNAGGGMSVIMYTVMYATIAYGLCNVCFKLIEIIPNQALSWIGQRDAREITQDERVAQALTGTGHTFMGLGVNTGKAYQGRLAAPKK